MFQKKNFLLNGGESYLISKGSLSVVKKSLSGKRSQGLLLLSSFKVNHNCLENHNQEWEIVSIV